MPICAIALAACTLAAQPPAFDVFKDSSLAPTGARATLDTAALAAAAAAETPFAARVPLPDGTAIDVTLESFRVLAPNARIVCGPENAPVNFDPARILFFRGEIPGYSGSHVFLSIADGSIIGRVELGPGAQTFAIRGHIDPLTGRQAVEVFEPVSIDFPAAMLGCDGGPPAATHGGGGRPGSPLLQVPVKGMKQAELAVDSDYELFTLFGDKDKTITYILQVYGQASDIMMRDIKVRLDIVFLRVFDNPNDPYGDSAGFPIFPPGTARDVGQLISGTRDIGSGGLAQLCGDASWIGFAIGFFVDPTMPNIYNQDIIIAAHELGHNLGTPHTHDLGVDDCDDPAFKTQRGSICSYCYYFSGGYANTDMRFQTVEQNAIAQCMSGQNKYAPDCNANHISDLLDISGGTSKDLNGNKVPDECEDCNRNGVLDPLDIAAGTSTDLDKDGTPDECQADCNGNGIPDTLDISSGFSKDLYGNRIPDECETDCDNNGTSDYTQIQLDMTLDIDRNAVLDACQDCDGDGTPDLVALDGANTFWAITAADQVIRQYHPITGVLMRSGTPGKLNSPQDLLIVPGRRILVSSNADHRIAEFDHTGAYVKDLVAAGAGGLNKPGGLLNSHDGRLLVASAGTNSVLAFDLQTGAPLGAFVAPGAGGLAGPYGLTFTPAGDLIVTSANNSIIQYDGATGAFKQVLVAPGAGGLNTPRGLAFVADGRLVVASHVPGALLAYNGTTGAPLGKFNYGEFGDGLAGTWGVRISPSGELYATGGSGLDFHLTDPRMLCYNGSTGWLTRAFIQRPDSKLTGPRGFDIMPGDGFDCNRNQLPDSCDIARGQSQDINNNGIPDECETCDADCDGSGELDIDDFICFQTLFGHGSAGADCDHSGELDIDDFICFQTAYGLGCD